MKRVLALHSLSAKFSYRESAITVCLLQILVIHYGLVNGRNVLKTVSLIDIRTVDTA